jgi:4'-phosphopantetheinyl transferase
MMAEECRAHPVGHIARLTEVHAVLANEGQPLALGPGDVDVWLCFYDTLDDLPWRSAFAALLTPQERARHDRLGSPLQQLEYLAARALCRHVLSRYAAVDPAEWRFMPGEHGKPHISGPPVAPPLWFNLSGTRGLVACAVSGATPTLGVDVEAVETNDDMLAVAAQFFSAREVDGLRALPLEQQHERFFTLWTLKESYAKARGLGIAALSLTDVAFALAGDGSIGLSLDPRLGDDAVGWRFTSLKVSADHLLAVAARLPAAAPLRLRVGTWTPQ